ncbi:MAG: flavin reductase family protein [Myxococcota bacterium]|jgi:flavin reductase (NADH)|nr:flavin reductase family protein [Myxococcota bacterium]
MVLVDDFKNALSAWASGVSVVTTRADGLAYGLTVSSFTSVSLDPPLILVCLGHGNRLGEMITRSGHLAVSGLARDQEAASNHFASRGREPEAELRGVPMVSTDRGIPVVEGALAWLDCDVHELVSVGDHTVVIGRVTEAWASGEGSPLLYWSRAYRGVDPS